MTIPLSKIKNTKVYLQAQIVPTVRYDAIRYAYDQTKPINTRIKNNNEIRVDHDDGDDDYTTNTSSLRWKYCIRSWCKLYNFMIFFFLFWLRLRVQSWNGKKNHAAPLAASGHGIHTCTFRCHHRRCTERNSTCGDMLNSNCTVQVPSRARVVRPIRDSFLQTEKKISFFQFSVCLDAALYSTDCIVLTTAEKKNQ